MTGSGHMARPTGSMTRVAPANLGPMQLKEFQQLIRDRYHATDSARGVPATFLWLTEEIGELASALAERERGGGDHEALASEFADVLAWLATIANVCEVDLESAIHAKYLVDGGPEGTK